MNEQLLTTMKQQSINRWLTHIVATNWQPIWEDDKSNDERLIEQVKTFFFQQRFQHYQQRL
ncbi:hypothetical protein D5085_16005 [Ectothiorhodospiraceae bacterium BW-2]|nr:hypothetical protein D5085_16005 [Ectothiorhodospiraceae bacterium BW-2]